MPVLLLSMLGHLVRRLLLKAVYQGLLPGVLYTRPWLHEELQALAAARH